jgi:sigma-B regulation protein RsbU (phosphoserine phosphatase)
MNSPKVMGTSSQEISVLILEDNPADAYLILHALQRAGFSLKHQVATSSASFMQLLTNTPFDVVLVDYYLPGWTGLAAIRWMKEIGLETPVIVVTGSLGDSDAVQCLKEGASDYVLKDKLERLVPPQLEMERAFVR